MKNKRMITFIVTLMLVLSTFTTAFAAELSLINTVAKKEHTVNTWVRSASILRDVEKNPTNYIIEVGEKLYNLSQVMDKMATDETMSIEKAVEGLDPVEKPETPGDLKVMDVSAINKTSVVVELNKNAEEVLTQNFFNVTGATVTGVEQGVTSNIWVLAIDSLDGTAGTVTVNGKSKAFDFKATTEKAKVEEVKFNNYRQFQVTFSEEVDYWSSIDPANYYFEIVEGQAGKLGANLGNDNNLEALKFVEGNWFAYTTEGGVRVGRKNIKAELVNGKTVVTINLPEGARFGAGANSLTVEAQTRGSAAAVVVGEDKLLVKDTTVYVAVRNVKDIDGVRSLDTSVKEMKINDSVSPKLNNVYLVDGNEWKLADTTKTVEVTMDEKLELEFNEPVQEEGVVLYLNGSKVDTTTGGAIKFEAADGLTASEYMDASIATLVLNNLLTGDNAKEGKVHNVKVVGVKDLAGNISVPSTIDLTIKIVKAQTTEDIKPEVKDVVQTADNQLRVEWNRAGAKIDTNGIEILAVDVVDVDTVKQNESVRTNSGPEAGRYFSYVTFGASDNPEIVDASNEILEYDEQNFIKRTIKITNVIADTLTNDTKFSKTMDLEKDVQAPKFNRVVIGNNFNNQPTDYQEVKSNGIKTISVEMKDVVPFGARASKESPVYVTKNVTTGGAITHEIATSTDNLKKIRVSYEKDGKVSTEEMTLTADKFSVANGVLTLMLPAELLNEDNVLVEGAVYKIEFPEAYFSDSKLIAASDNNADLTDYETIQWVDSRRSVDLGFTTLAFDVEVEVPGSKDKVEGDLVPQTSKSLITVTSQPSVNRDEIQVEFKGSIDADTLKNPSNYSLNGRTLAEWGVKSSDIKFVVERSAGIITKQYARFYAPVGSVVAAGNVEIVVSGVANIHGAKMTEVKTFIALEDNKAPEVIEKDYEGSKKIILTFDEPLAAIANEATAAKNFRVRVNGELMAVESVTTNADDSRQLVIELSQDFAKGSTVELEVVEDNNGNIFITDNATYKNKLVKGTKITVEIGELQD